MKNGEYKHFQKNFLAFKARHNLTDSQIIQIMTEYANTEDQYSASFFIPKYNISAYEFYQMKDFTIIFMLVDASVCQRIRDKTFRNQSKKNTSGNYSSASKHYWELIDKRKEYLKRFTDEEIVLISTEYANGEALRDIARKRDISEETVRKLLAISLANHLIDDETYHLIKHRSDSYIHSIRDYSGYTVEDLTKYSHWG